MVEGGKDPSLDKLLTLAISQLFCEYKYISDNHSDLTIIKIDTGQHRQFLQCLKTFHGGWKLLPFEWRWRLEGVPRHQLNGRQKIRWNENWPSFDNNHMKLTNKSEIWYISVETLKKYYSNIFPPPRVNFFNIFLQQVLLVLSYHAQISRPPPHWPLQPFVQK